VNERDIFIAALRLTDPGERSAYVDQACAGDAALRQRVNDLLDIYAQAGSFLQQPAGAPEATAALPLVADHQGTRVGAYKLLQKIGEGGMGAVYMAEQQEPVRRLVAIKLIKPGQDSAQVLARFEAERQALALMDHPNIARVLDAGAATSGQPYFVMELIKGVPITKYCDEHHLTPRERLSLFVPLCQAIQHAHQKGIIHRDLKPSNVLVCLYDGKPLPKVIDFGVAKATGQKLTERTLFTDFGSIVGTLEYMSPEQAQLDQLDIDTRSDIYSLGVLLYELLTGTTPLERKRLKTEAFLELLRIIREVEPPKPSSRLTDSKDSLPSLAAQRQLEPAGLTRAVRGELDWIVMKCLDKDRARRYETANGLARDVERYLQDEPVEAGPPSASYKLRKYARKHRRLLATSAAFVVLLLVGVVVSAWQAVRATAAERISTEQATRAKAAELEALALAEMSQRRLIQIGKANDILGSIFQKLDPNAETIEDKPLRVLLGERLDRATRELDGDAVGDPLAVAKLQVILGDSQLGLGNPEKAVVLFNRAREAYTANLGPNHIDTLSSMHKLANAYGFAGKVNKAVQLFEETLSLYVSQLGPNHVDTLSTMNDLGSTYHEAGKLDKALPLLEKSLDLLTAKLAPDHSDRLDSMNNLALAYLDAGKVTSAVQLLEATLELRTASVGPSNPLTLKGMNNLARAYQDAGKLKKALQLREKSFDLAKANLGLDHPITGQNMGGLAEGYHFAGHHDKAVALYQELLNRREATLGADHRVTLKSRLQLASHHRRAGKWEQAAAIAQKTLEVCKAKLGPDDILTINCLGELARNYENGGKVGQAIAILEELVGLHKAKFGSGDPATLMCMHRLAGAYMSDGKVNKALSLYQETFKLRKESLGLDHPSTLATMNDLAWAYEGAGMNDRALSLYEQAFGLMKAKRGMNHPDTLIMMNNLASAYQMKGKLELSLPLHQQALDLTRTTRGPTHPETLNCLMNLAWGYLAAGKLDRSIPLMEETVEKMKIELGSDHPRTISGMRNLARGYEDIGKLKQADFLLRDVLERQRKMKDSNASELAATLFLLGRNLILQGRYAESEPLARKCLEIQERAMPESWRLFCSKSILGAALLGQKKYADAETLLLEGYEGMKNRESQIAYVFRCYLTESLDRLVQLYDATNKPEKSKIWREKLKASRTVPLSSNVKTPGKSPGTGDGK
jgi:eukaryotic-like serine/threonine-protein kinase